ncbi:oligopeptide transport ATP-binding protein OppF [Mesobacillus boroniphilus JCM 21738]|uniref:Oligopeptide transport ATP-binding protein OppF n=1 Tax=Mesobacillus boroniphilus JCM 21738 TaxID=1294265 RepID=W4RPC9_9BACI|nr:oligopeptide transport ATP-binding protein OppF [Mesobacillus boroniphilus JCM 21738]
MNKGETLGIVGESGCGKSTVGRTIIRLYEPTDGKIIFSGRDISHLSESELRKDVRKNIQMIFRIRSRLLTLGKH